MKKVIVLFKRQTFLSAAAGAIKTYTHEEDKADVLGQAKLLRVRFFGERRTANARATIKAFEGAIAGRRPAEIGSQIGASQVISSLRPEPFNVAAPFEGRVELTVDIDASSGGAVEEFEFQIVVTAIMEE